ncbi:MAG: PAS domain-containing protein [Acidobacteria bacterium]|nr:PAS domain-containing protein [Acidobacteriota bacterium]
MNRFSPETAVLRLGDDGHILTATAAAADLFGARSLERIPFNEILKRSFGRGEWKRGDGGSFEAETFGIRRDGRPLELRVVLPDPDDDPITRRKRDSLLSITADVFRAGSDDLDEAIVDALGRMGRLIRVDRAYVFLMSDQQTATNTHEWSRAGTDPQIDRLGEVSRTVFRWFEEQLRQDSCLVIHTVDEMPSSASDAKAHLEDQGIRSLLLVGMFERDELLGFVGFDAVSRKRKWSSRTIERLRWIAELFIQSLLRAKSQRELEQTKELFDRVRMATNDIIYDWNLEEGSVIQGEGLERILGYAPSRETADPDWWMGLIHPDDRERIIRETDAAFADPAASVWSGEYRVRRADGGWTYMLDRACIIRDETGKALRSIGTASDMTDRARAEERLRKQEELFQYVRLATNDIIWDLDLVSRTVWRSEALEAVLGFPPGTDQGLEWWLERIHPEDVGEHRAMLSEMFNEPGSTFLEHTYRIRHRDEHWVYILDRGYVIRNEEGRAIRMIGTSTDLTERMRATRDLETSEARFRAVVENVSDVIAIVSLGGVIIYQSPSSARVFGYASAELVGQNMFSNVHPDDRERVESIFVGAVTSRLPEARATFRYRHAAGHWLRVETVGSNFINREQMGGVVLVSRDISQRRQIEQQLERSARLASLGHLASSVAHEFNNVLMGAQPFIEVIRRTSDPARIGAAADRIEEAIDRGKDVSRGLLQFARPMAVSIDTFDLRSWLQSLEDEIQRIVPERMRVVVTVPNQPLPTIGDPAGLHQALLNLVLHAGEVLENRPDGTIEIAARKADARDRAENLISGDPEDFVALSVGDNGPEIDASVLEHIFEPMFKAHHASPGGLDLTVVHQLIMAQGGQVRAVSTKDGTTFHVFLRSRRDVTATERAAPRIDSSETTLSVILLVEDNAIVASGIAAVLELDEQKVEVAHSGAAAVERLLRDRPSVVILDIGLPDMSGVEVYEQIEKLYPDLPVVFSSGHGDQQELKRYLDRPNVEFLLKPYDAETLMTIVERLRSGNRNEG